MDRFDTALETGVWGFKKPVLFWGANEDRLVTAQILLQKWGQKKNYAIYRTPSEDLLKVASPSLFQHYEKRLFIVSDVKNLTITDFDQLDFSQDTLVIIAPGLNRTSKYLKNPLVTHFETFEALPWDNTVKLRLAKLILGNVSHETISKDAILSAPLSTLEMSIHTLQAVQKNGLPWENVSRETFCPDVGDVRRKIYQVKSQLTRGQGNTVALMVTLEELLQAELTIKSTGKPTTSQGLLF